MAALSSLPHAFWHHADCAHALSQTAGNEDLSLLVFEGESGVLAAPVIERVYEQAVHLTSPTGYAGVLTRGNPLKLQEELKIHLRDRGITTAFFAVHPELSHPHWKKSDAYYEHQDAFFLDLTPPLPVIRAKMQKGRRTQIKCPPLTTFVDDPAELEGPLIDLYNDAAQRLGFGPAYRLSAETLIRWLYMPGCLALGAKHEHRIEAISLFPRTAALADYAVNANSVRGRSLASPLIWEAISRLKEEKIPTLNLGGGIVRHDSLAQFKKRFGARPRPQGALRMVIDKYRFAQLCHEFANDHAILAQARPTFFPPYARSRKPTIPISGSSPTPSLSATLAPEGAQAVNES